MAGADRNFNNAFEQWPALPPPFVTMFHSPMNRTVMPLPPSWVSVYGVIVPLFVRVALPQHAHWFVDMTKEGITWCFGRGWESFVIHAGFQSGDELMFSYQSDGLFIVSVLAPGPQVMFFDEGVVAIAPIEGVAPVVDMQQLFEIWDTAACAMANNAGIAHPPAEVFDLFAQGGDQPQDEDAAPNSPQVEDAELAAALRIAVFNTEGGAAFVPGLNLGQTHVGEGSGVGHEVSEEHLGNNDAVDLIGGETHVGQSSGAGLNLDLDLRVGHPKKSLISRSGGPVFVRRLEPTHITQGVTISKSFWDAHIRKEPGTYELTFHMADHAWRVGVRYNKARVRVTHGWPDFVEYNNFVVGSMLRFELVRACKSNFIVTFR